MHKRATIYDIFKKYTSITHKNKGICLKLESGTAFLFSVQSRIKVENIGK